MITDKRRAKKLGIRFALEAAFVAALLAIDLLSKSLVFAFLDKQTGARFTVWEGIFTLVQAKNYGASFGIFDGKAGFLIALTVLVTAALVIFLVLRPDTKRSFRIASLAIVAGALGNVVDRAAYGYVRDFIDYTFLKTFFGIDFAIGNIADLFLMFGCILLLVYIVFEFQEGDFRGVKKRAQLQAAQAAADGDASDDGASRTDGEEAEADDHADGSTDGASDGPAQNGTAAPTDQS